MKKRLLSAFLAVMMVLTMAPVAFAADGETTSEPVAQVDGTDYATLAEAIAAADGKTLTLLKDVNGQIVIPEGKTVTLDLNGNTVTAPSGRYDAVINQGTLTVTDSQKTGEIISNGNGGIGISAGSDTTIEYAKVTGREGAIGGDKSTVGAKLTINDGVFTGVDNAVVIFNGSKRDGDANKITINGGIFNGKIQSSGYVACGIYAPWKDDITVNNGTFNIENGAGIVARGGMVTVKGGEFNTTGNITGMVGDYKGTVPCSALVFDSTAGYPGMDDDSQIVVEDGKFKSDVAAVTVIKQTSDAGNRVKVSGGTFSSDVSAYVAEGYVQNANGTVKQLGETNAVAKIGDTYYKTLADAYAALPRNAGTDSEPTTITVLKDSEGKAIGSDSDKGMNYVIDFGGHTYTVGKPAVGSTGTETQGLRVLKGSKAVFKNGTLKAVNYPDMKMPVHTYGDVTFQDFTVDATEDSYAQIAYEIDNGSLNMIGNSSILAYPGKIGLYVSFWPRGGYTDGTTVNIDTTGKITGKMVYEWDDKADTAEQQKENKAVLNITNGYFDITGIQTLFTSTIPSELKVTKISISGGYFTTDPSDYVASDYVAGTSDVSGYSYKVVAKTNTGSVEVKPDVADPEVTVSGSISEEDKQKVENAAKTVSAPTLGAETGDIVKDINEDTAKTLIEKATTVQGNNKKLYVQSSLKVEPTAYDAANKTLALEITPQYRIVASTAASADDIELGDNGNAQVVQDYTPMNITKATVVTMELPAGFAVDNGAKLSIQHTKSNGTVEYYTGTVTKKDDKLYLTFTTNGFSPFVISVPAASIGENVYPTLQAAVDSVKNNETIKLAQDVAVSDVAAVTVTANKTFKIDTTKDNSGTYVFDAEKNIVAGNRTSIAAPTKEGNVYMYTCTYNKPSSGGSSGGSSSGKTTYKVTTSAVNNGGVNASPSSAEKGATITITLSPDKGYKLDKLTITDGSGKTVSTVKKSDTVYTFTMPASAVKVGVSYVKATETPSETKFNDVSANDWFASAVDYVTGKGMMNGTADNTFSPKANTTRGMVVTVLYRLENQPSTSAASFTDVASGAYYANAVAWANANGIVSGYGSGKFGPNDKVTREQLAAILYRYAQYKKYDVSVGEDTNILSYDDAQSISSYAIPAIQWACGAGVVTGKSGSKLDPKGNATRAEVAAMLMRFCENVK